MKLWITERGIDMKTLKDVSIGQTVKVKKLTGEGPVKRRIMDISLISGAVFSFQDFRSV